MKVVLDTNVLSSGIFFGGLPRVVLDAWAEERFQILVSPLIFDEYVRTCERLSESHPGLDFQSVLASIIGHGKLVPDLTSSVSITADPDDDKFMLCARDWRAIIVSGDQHLLDASGWEGVRVMKAHDFLEYLNNPNAT